MIGEVPRKPTDEQISAAPLQASPVQVMKSAAYSSYQQRPQNDDNPMKDAFYWN